MIQESIQRQEATAKSIQKNRNSDAHNMLFSDILHYSYNMIATQHRQRQSCIQLVLKIDSGVTRAVVARLQGVITVYIAHLSLRSTKLLHVPKGMVI